jgi:hypothetical protein
MKYKYYIDGLLLQGTGSEKAFKRIGYVLIGFNEETKVQDGGDMLEFYKESYLDIYKHNLEHVQGDWKSKVSWTAHEYRISIV